MGVDIEKGVAWMQARKGRVSYSMDFRDGPDSYDCSSSMYYALRSAGASSAGWAVNTEYMHAWLIENGYELISENAPWDAKRGDIFIWGRKGASAGAGGHTGMFIDSDNIIHCNYAYDGISVNDHDERWYYAGQPYYYVYRLTNANAQPAEKKLGWQKDATGFWYARANGTYPKDEFEYIEENKSWFYFDDQGYMLAEKWLKHTDGNWYWFDRDGYMATSWKRIGESWYYFNRDGSMVTGWIKYYDNWYYCDATNGDMKSNAFIRYNDGWYLLLPDGRLADKPQFTVEPDGLITAKV
ncbi:endolysin [Streptococcus phage Dp-1]|uniref:Lysin n=1 Tax=Pneumococcus phage Dp-1 TaxID=59241 RepID=ALYS_BPDP1|nr:endolysin [Streptococcus phage Dp-1]O03979.1 RecName: Full=Lysin; AltName: Full=Cell wall hydrolase; AltName: Full=Lytic amidase; AltName: Full=N-acetylmuramoyl-L-alanine amidase [Streptococcus phage Dp-1]ADT64066.1 endolysin [Streptococcus phage Dp-1]CAB07986.1 N-acetylmuramoyl-L-alanine amidase [Streptococcus phage Dp-1]